MSFSRNFGLPFCAVLALFVWPSTAREKEKKIHRSDLPPAVEKTVAAESVAGSTIRGFSREQESGKVCYEAEMTVNGHSKDLLIAPDGSIVEVEEEVLKIESITKHGKVVAYEAMVDRNGKKSEVQVGPDGKPLDHEE